MQEQKHQPANSQGGRPSKRRKVKLPHYSKLNKRVIEKFSNFVDAVPAQRLNRNLRDLFIEHLSLNEEILLCNQYQEFPVDLLFLLQFLDAIADEIQDE